MVDMGEDDPRPITDWRLRRPRTPPTCRQPLRHRSTPPRRSQARRRISLHRPTPSASLQAPTPGIVPNGRPEPIRPTRRDNRRRIHRHCPRHLRRPDHCGERPMDRPPRTDQTVLGSTQDRHLGEAPHRLFPRVSDANPPFTWSDLAGLLRPVPVSGEGGLARRTLVVPGAVEVDEDWRSPRW